MKLNLYSGIALTMLFGLIFNVFIQALIALVALIVLRRFSGGFHLPISLCSLVTAILSTLAAGITLNHLFIHMFTALSLVAMMLFAPISFEGDDADAFHPLAKTISIVLIASNFVFQSSTLAMMFIFQSTFILPIYSTKGGEIE
ncbi:hypothetical protein A3849_19085 [Paenibacillus sp. P46E]|nr:hypothetical protein A3849_19085 [Paenibacillus sp. P46E]